MNVSMRWNSEKKMGRFFIAKSPGESAHEIYNDGQEEGIFLASLSFA